jgi:hypothetical protein
VTATAERKASGQRLLALENESIRATVLVDNGADIYELVYKPTQTDVLFKPRWGLRDRHALGASPVLESWIDAYSGGWQEILPNAGLPSIVGGATLPFFGEVAVSPWEFEVVTDDGDTTEVVLSITLVRSPLKLVRKMLIERGKASLVLSERLVNDGAVPTESTWPESTKASTTHWNSAPGLSGRWRRAKRRPSIFLSSPRLRSSETSSPTSASSIPDG